MWGRRWAAGPSVTPNGENHIGLSRQHWLDRERTFRREPDLVVEAGQMSGGHCQLVRDAYPPEPSRAIWQCLARPSTHGRPQPVPTEIRKIPSIFQRISVNNTDITPSCPIPRAILCRGVYLHRHGHPRLRIGVVLATPALRELIEIFFIEEIETYFITAP